MSSDRYFVFGDYCIDRLEGRLWHGADAVALTRKAQRLLEHFAANAGRLVTKEELLRAVWPRSVVVEGVLTTAVRELRRALGDDSRAPTFIQTAHRQGYRFIAPVSCADVSPASARSRPAQLLVGRSDEWGVLQEAFATAFAGMRQVVFLAGEPGIGKTAIVDEFVAHVAAQSNVVAMRGQCIEHYGSGEAYLPIFEALARLIGDSRLPLDEILLTHAPSWRSHLPGLPDSRAPHASGVAPARMLRELSAALEQLSTVRPVLFVLEDLQWSDTATLDWLAHFARRRDCARVLVLATYRPVEVIVQSHPLRAMIGELQRQSRCTRILLDYLDLTAVREYLARRFTGLTQLAELAQVLHRRTSGQPLFMVTIVEALLREGVLSEQQQRWTIRAPLTSIADLLPASVSQLVEKDLDTMTPRDLAILEAASVAGEHFTVGPLHAASGLSEEHIEARLADWAQQQRFFLGAGSSSAPDGTISSSFRFRHALFQDAVYRRIPDGRRARWHRAIAMAIAQMHAADPSAVAAELALHFERGGEQARAVECLEQAAQRALQRSAYREALRHVRRALALGQGAADSIAVTAQRARLQMCLAAGLRATKGWADTEVEAAHREAKALCEQIGDSSGLIDALWGLIAVSVVRGDLPRTQLLSEELLELTRERHHVPFQLAGHMELAGVAFGVGDLSLADEEFRLADRLYDPAQHAEHLARVGCDQGVLLRSWWSHLAWHRGDDARAIALSEDAMRLARGFNHPLTQAIAWSYAAILQQFRQDVAAAARLAATCIELCTEHDLTYYLTWSRIIAGWCNARSSRSTEAAVQIAESIGALHAASARRCLPYFHAVLAEVHIGLGDFGAADTAIDEGIALLAANEVWWSSELLRLKALVAISREPRDVQAAHQHLDAAISQARLRRSPPLLERALADLARLEDRLQPAAIS